MVNLLKEKFMNHKLIYPMKHVNITQGSLGEFSHKNVYAIDLAGSDSGADEVFAQGTGKVIEITDKSVTVRYDNIVGQSGVVYKYAEVLYYHQTANPGIKVGQQLRMGQVFMREGMKGNATGNHIHVEIKCMTAKGLVPMMPERMFFADPRINRQIRNDGKEPVRLI
jgi:murein DD-endopeptidase MepM/ murein hydrolase activator NlpD